MRVVHVVRVPDLRVGHVLCDVDIRLGVYHEEGLRVKHRTQILVWLELGHDVLADDKKLVAPAEDFQYAVKLLKKQTNRERQEKLSLQCM